MGNPREGKDSFLRKVTHADFSLHMEEKIIPGDEMGTSGLRRVEIILNLKSELFFHNHLVVQSWRGLENQCH